MAGSVQFYGKDQAMQAFQHSQMPAWSFWQGTQFQCKGIGAESLEAWIDMIIEGGATNAIYTIKVYEDIEDAKKIKDKTPIDGSFSFRLNEPEIMRGESQKSYYGIVGTLQTQIAELKKQIEQRDQEEDEEEKTIGKVIGDVVIEALQDPSKLISWIEIFKSVLSPGNAAAPAAPVRNLPYPVPNAAVGNINQQEKTMTEEEMQKVVTALQILEEKDPKIVDHMEKLARLAKNNPKKFDSLIAILDLME